MDTQENLIEPLLARAEECGKASLELMKLKMLLKTADVTSTLVSRLILLSVITISVFTLTVAAALWLGEIFGKVYYGFLLITGVYVFAALILSLLHPFIKIRVSNSIIAKMLN